MMGYVGKTGATRLGLELNSLGIGEAVQYSEWPPSRFPFFLDNEAWKDHSNGTPFREAAFLRVIERVESEGPTPDFIVAPDMVANPLSLEWSLSWVPKIRGAGPLAFVVQDGMQDDDVRRALRVGQFSVLFVGGSLGWKFQTLPRWVEIGHAMGLRVHVGRMGTGRRVRYARSCGADSVDSCTPLWSKGNLKRFMAGLRGPLQRTIGPPAPPPVVSVNWTSAASRREAKAAKAKEIPVVSPQRLLFT